MKKISPFLAVFFLLALCGGAAAADTLAKIKSKGTMRVGVRGDVPPFGFLNRTTGKPQGFDIDYAAEIAKKLGVQVEYLTLRASERLSSLLDNKVELLAATLVKNADRDLLIDFSNPYISTGQKLLVKKGVITKEGDIVGKKIGVVMGTPSEVCARNSCPAAIIVPYEDYSKVVAALTSGDIDAFSSDQAILSDILTTLPQGEYDIPPFYLNQEDYALGYVNGDKAFGDFLNKTVDELEKDGTTAKLRDKWFSPTISRPPAAYGAVMRRTVTGTRFVGVTLNGYMFQNAEIAVYSPTGERITKGRVASVVGDEFYFDVDQASYNLIQSGYLVTMNIEQTVARSLLADKSALFKTVKDSVDKEEAAANAEAAKADAEKEKRDAELARLKEQNRLQIDLEREKYYQLRKIYDDYYLNPPR